MGCVCGKLGSTESSSASPKDVHEAEEKKLGSGRAAVTTVEVPRPLALVGGFVKALEAEQVAAGWPPWLASVAGEAIRGWLPRRADSFEKLDKIGQGTYSNVYRARDIENNKIVALKKVRFDNLEPESVKFMAREILILRRLNHPNVIKLEGLVTSRMSCSLYLVFEYMEHDLSGLASFPGLKFSEPQVKCYMRQLLSGLDHCHSRGILHRDIKGSNLLIDNNGILKIGDFGLASFYDPDLRIPLTSRVVTLWYRPPELLLGATNYGVSVDLWSTGCILAELHAGKPIMPGRTEVEQLHKIFKLCGSPSEDYWRKSKLPHATIFKPQQPYKRCVAETFKDFPPSALALIEVLLSVDPANRGTAASALKSEYFTMKPLPCEPSSLPKYPPCKEFDVKRREDETRRQGTASGKVNRLDLQKKGHRESRAVPAPEANAELASSMQRMRGSSKSRSEKFYPHEDAASGFPIEPPQAILSLKSTEEPQSCHPIRASHSGPLVNRNHLPAQKDEDDLARISMATKIPALSGLIAARRKLMSDDGSKITIAQEGPPASRSLQSKSELSDGRKYNPVYNCREEERNNNIDQSNQGCAENGSRIHYSGPLLRSSGNVDKILKEHDRQVQEAFRRARHDKSRNRRALGERSQFSINPSSIGVISIFPSSRGSSVFASNRGSLQ